ncbi:MAG: NAD+ synthase, partial [Chlamydiia bacterium]|nr:NAD+ synthase [Chlamydiia bacterium]
MKILVAQINPVIGDIEANTQKVLDSIQRGRKSQADIILFPELTLCGYPPQDLVYHQTFISKMEESLQTIAENSKDLMVVVGLARPNLGPGERGLSNSAAVLIDQKLVGFQDKWLLPNYDIFNERFYFDPGQETQTFTYKNKKIGILICEDIWQHSGYVSSRYSRDPVLEMEKLNPDLLLNLSASPYQYDKPDQRVEVCAKAARTLKCPLVYCAQVGANDSLIFDGYSVYVDQTGELRQLAKGFQEDHMHVDLDAASCPCPFSYDPMSDLYKALVLGVRDYFHKSGFTKACLGLSGGVDSALVACITAEALGPENLLGIFMPSRYTCDLSKSDAKQLAANLGIQITTVPIEEPFTEYLNLLKPHFGALPPDTTEENLQARLRGIILMAFSNKLGHVVVSTGNKSEFALGYCTLYGDMCGGLAPIADLPKMLVYELARHLNRERERIPLSSIEKPPSAELRPGQRDEDSLPPYPLL